MPGKSLRRAGDDRRTPMAAHPGGRTNDVWGPALLAQPFAAVSGQTLDEAYNRMKLK